MALPSLSIVIPTYNGRAHLERCLPSVCAHAPARTQLLVIDDCSTDDTATWISQHFPNVEFHRLEKNLGFCGAANFGLAQAHGDVVELLNNDTEVLPGWADACLQHFADPTVGSVAPLVVQMHQPEVIDSAGMDYHFCGWAFNRRLGRTIGADDLLPREVFGASGSAGFYRRSAVEKVGRLWPIYGAYFEDTDLAFRLRWAGFRCIYEPTSRVAHYGTATYGHQSDRHVYLISRNEEIAFWTNLPRWSLLLGVIPHFAFLMVRMVRKTLSRQARTFLAGKMSALSAWRDILRQRRKLHQLAAEARGSARLAITTDLGILRRGIRWLRHGQTD